MKKIESAAENNNNNNYFEHIARPMSLTVFYSKKTLGFKGVNVTPFYPEKKSNIPFDKLWNLCLNADPEILEENSKVALFAMKTLAAIDTIRLHSSKSEFFIEFGQGIPKEFFKSLARIENLTVTFSGWPATELKLVNDQYQRAVAFFRKKQAEYNAKRAERLAAQQAEEVVDVEAPTAKTSVKKSAKKPASKPASETALSALAEKHPHKENKDNKIAAKA